MRILWFLESSGKRISGIDRAKVLERLLEKKL